MIYKDICWGGFASAQEDPSQMKKWILAKIRS